MAGSAAKQHSPDPLQRIEAHLRAGKVNEAQRDLLVLAEQKVTAADRLPLASLARRADLPSLSIKLLYPLVRPTRKTPGSATDLEKMEYAAALIKIGALEEALDLLSKLTTKDPRKDLFIGFGKIHKWDYEGAIPHLVKFLKREKKDVYLKMVAGVNLASAYVFQRDHERARTTIDVLLTQTRAYKLDFLRANCLDLAAENAIFQGNWKEAEACLRQAEKILNSGDRFEFFIRKWKAILDARKNKGSPGSLLRLESIETEARERGLWESIRECRRTRALLLENDEELLHLYAGTPFAGFRKVLIKESKSPFPISEKYTWKLKPGRSPHQLDLVEGEEKKSGAKLKLGQILHQALLILSSDFYRPFRLPSLFASLYPTEFYNPETSPPRVHQILNRLKRWLDENDIPLRVEEKDGTYRLTATRPCTIYVPLTVSASKIDFLRRHFEKEAFTIDQASKVLDVSVSTTLRIIKTGMEQNSLVKVGRGPQTSYRFI